MRTITTIFFALFVSSCMTMTMGRDYDPALLDELRDQNATRAEVLSRLGDPQTRSKMPDGTETWTYTYTESHSFVNPASLLVPFYTRVDSDTKTKTTTVVFDSEGQMSEWKGSFLSGLLAPN